MYLRNVLNNSSWLLFEKGFRLISVFLTNAYIARYLGPNHYGVLALLLNILSLLWGVANLGADSITVRELSTNKGNGNLLSTLFVARFIVGISLYAVIYAVVEELSENQDIKIYWAIAGLAIILQAGEVVDLKYQSELKSKFTVVSKVFALFLSSVGKILLIFLKLPLFAFVIANFIEYALFIGALVVIYRVNFSSFIIEKPSCNRFRIIIRESWPVIVSGLGTYIYWKSDVLILNSLLGSNSVGIYTAATTISQLPTNFPTIIMISFMPYLSKQYIEDYPRFLIIFRKLIMYGWISSITTACIIYIAANQIINIIYGETYHESSNLLRVHAFTVIPITIGIISSTWFTVIRKTHHLIPKVIVGAILCPTLNYILIPIYGSIGAAISALASTILVDLVLIRLIDKTLFSLVFGVANV